MSNPRDRKFVVASRPVNRRTTPRPPPPPAPASPLAQERLLATQARRRMGPPLAEQLRPPAERRRPLRPAAVAGGMLAAGSAIALGLGWLQGVLPLALAGGIGAAAGLAVAWRYRQRPDAALPHAPVALLDEADIAALDRTLEQLAPELTADVAQQLAQLKLLVARIARHPHAGSTDEHFTLEDRMYVVECVRRYLPDSLQAYLAVPRAQRQAAVAQEQTPQALLAAQLELLRAGLQERETRLARSAAEQLLKQERFLRTKR